MPPRHYILRADEFDAVVRLLEEAKRVAPEWVDDQTEQALAILAAARQRSLDAAPDDLD